MSAATSPKDCMAAFVAALIRRDIEAALALLTDDVAFFYSNGSSLWGKQAFAAATTASWRRVERHTYTTDEAVWLAEFWLRRRGRLRLLMVRGGGRRGRCRRRPGHEGLPPGTRRLAHRP